MINYGLSGKVALVTGVSRQRGIGAAIVRQLAALGANIFTTYYRPFDELMSWGSNSNEASEIIESLKLYGVKAVGIEANLAEPETPKNLFDSVEENLGQVDILVIDTLRHKCTEIQGSTSPLELDSLRYLTQRWFSPQALTFGLPDHSCISTKFV